jgi:hypothetical protein
MNFQEFNERFGPIQNPFGGAPGIANLMYMPGTPAMQLIQSSPPGYVWTLLQLATGRALVNGFITADNRIGYMLVTAAYDADEHFEVGGLDDLGLAP